MEQKHFLEPLSPGPKLTFNFGVYDVETFSIGNLDLNLIGAYDGKKYRVFRDMGSFYNFALDKRFEGWRWFAHYGGKFDIRFILETIRQCHPRCSYRFSVSGSSIINFTIIKSRGGKIRKWHFVDSGRLLPDSLKKLTESFNVEHKKLDFDPNSIEYNKNDCMGLYEVLQKFFGLNGICSETIASHSMRVFRTHYLKRKIPVVHEDVEEFVRSAYFGGRCEVFRWDPRELNLFDINSMYPSVMKGLIPVAYRARSTSLPDSDEQGIGFYEAEVDYPETYSPCLPWHHDKLYFPMGKMIVRASSMELRQAIMDGAKVRIKRGCIFDVDYLFADYVDMLYKMKQEADRIGDNATRTVCKLLLNSLYGKFGQRRDQVSYALDPGTCFLDGDEGPRVWPIPGIHGVCYYQTKSTSAHILPHIAATITAQARLMILKSIRQAGNVYYTDTDSIFTPETIGTSTDLGKMSLKGSGLFQAYGVKEYTFGGEMALKGIPLTVTDPLTGIKTQDYTLGNKYMIEREQVKYQRMAGIMESIRTGKTTLRYIDVVRMKQVTLPKRAKQGEVNTRPWTVPEILKATVKSFKEEYGSLL